MATKKQYFGAVISHQNDTWKLMYDSKKEEFLYNFIGNQANPKMLAGMLARAYTICYNLIHSGNADIDVENVCIPDVGSVVWEYFFYRNTFSKVKDRHVAIVSQHVYNDMFGTDYSLSFVEEYI